jgi:hypothetical protein
MMRIPGDAEQLEASAREHLTDVVERLAEKDGRILGIAAKPTTACCWSSGIPAAART